MLDPMFREYYERQKLKPLEDDLQFTAEDCYAFRNACLHSGMSKDKKRKFVLIPPPPSGGIVHKLSRNGTLQLQIDVLCLDICEAVDNWSETVSDNKEIQQRISELIEVKLNHFPGIHIT